MPEINVENLKSIQQRFDLDDVKKQSPLFFVDEDEKRIYLLSANDWFSEPGTSHFYPFPLSLKIEGKLYKLHITKEAIKISTPRNEEKKLLKGLKNAVNATLSKDSIDLHGFKDCLQKIARWGRIERIKEGFSNVLEIDLETIDNLIEQKKKKGNWKSNLDKVLKRNNYLGMAITTKVLRIANPENFIVFDSVFYQNFKPTEKEKFSVNAEGYANFLKEVEKFKKDIGELSKDGENISLGDLEFALYQLVQLVLKEFNWQDKCTAILDDLTTHMKKTD